MVVSSWEAHGKQLGSVAEARAGPPRPAFPNISRRRRPPAAALHDWLLGVFPVGCGARVNYFRSC